MSSRYNDQQLRGIGMTSERTRRRMIERLRERGIDDEEVLAVMGRVPRHLFVDEALAHRVYDDGPVPIGLGQTLSSSLIVATMTSLLRMHAPPGGLQKVLEIGTGSGYQTTVLAPLVENLFTVERLEPLQEKARRRCRELGLTGIRFHLSDGHWGWPDHAPYDGILCAAAPETVPEALYTQLNPEGGVLLIPVGPENDQHLYCITRNGDEWDTQILDAVRFVPLVNEGRGNSASHSSSTETLNR